MWLKMQGQQLNDVKPLIHKNISSSYLQYEREFELLKFQISFV